jgi:hypothetical protein
MQKLLYKPFGIIAGIISVRVGRKLFRAIWGTFDRRDPPKASNENAPLPRVVGAAVIEAATFAATRAAVDRASLKWFQFLTGIWAGDQQKPPTREDA